MTSYPGPQDHPGFSDQLQNPSSYDTRPQTGPGTSQCQLAASSTLGIILVVFGSIVVILQITLLESHKEEAQYTAAGIWGGTLAIVDGVFGILVGVKRTPPFISAFTTLSGLSAFTILFPFGTSMAATTAHHSWTGYVVPDNQLVPAIMMGFFCFIICVSSVTAACLSCCSSCNTWTLPMRGPATGNPAYDTRGMQYQMPNQPQV